MVLPATWDVLAPFAAGTREFGADPLEAFGGIRQIYARKQPSEVFPSELVFGGYVNWTSTAGGNSQVNIGWDSSWVNWPLIEGWGGLTASQFRGWAVGRLTVSRAGMYIVTCTGVTEYFIDERPFRGDVYGLGYGLNSVWLSESSHTMYIPFSGMEGTSFACTFNDAPPHALQLQPDHIIPDMVVNGPENVLAGNYFGLAVLNLLNTTITSFFVETDNFQMAEILAPHLAPHQAGIISFAVAPNSARGSAVCSTTATAANAVFRIYPKNNPIVLVANVTINCKKWGQPYAFTFMDVDGSVQYAATRPPINQCPSSGCPVLFTFHGAGVYARKDAWVFAYQQQKSSWLLFPTNRRQFGFDWEGPGHTNAWMAMNALTTGLPGVPLAYRSYFKANAHLIQYAGHSMGGHGCWYISTHAPDRALSISPAAGWIKMGMYIPFFTRSGDSLADPHLQSILMSAISMHNTDFYMRNINGVPLMVRMGADDNNVPPYHLKRMARIHNQLASSPNATVISEIPGESHWWGGVVDDAQMQSFFDAHFDFQVPALPDSFTISTMSPADFESRGGIQITQFISSGRAGYIRVTRAHSNSWQLVTKNIRRFQFIDTAGNGIPQPTSVTIDGVPFSRIATGTTFFCRTEYTEDWYHCPQEDIGFEKSRTLIGPIPRILEGELIIIVGTLDASYRQAYERAALMLANTLYYQGRYTPKIVLDTDGPFDVANLIVFGSPRTNTYLKAVANDTKLITLPVRWGPTKGFRVGDRPFEHESSALAFIMPYPYRKDALVLVVDANSVESVPKAAGLIPTKSSWTVPDWVATGPEYGWNGAAGLLGAGYWSHDWKYDAANSWVLPFDEM